MYTKGFAHWLSGLVLAFGILVVVPGEASAMFASVRVCFKYDANYVDAAAGDYWTGGGDRAGRGVNYILSTSNGSKIDAWADEDSGCSPVLPLLKGATYSVTVRSQAKVSGNTVKVRDRNDGDNLKDFRLSSTSFTADRDKDVVITARSDSSVRALEVLAAASYAIYKRPAGVTGETFDIYVNPSDGISQNIGSNIFIGNNTSSTGSRHAQRKFVIAHEVGHQLFFRRNEDKSISAGYGLSSGSCTANGSHSFETVEHTRSAVNEGLAHFYAAMVWNARESDCEFAYYKNVDMRAGSTGGNITCGDGTDESRVVYSCESGSDFALDCCSQSAASRGSETDWLRFFWDVWTDSNVGHVNIFNIVDYANLQDAGSSSSWARLRTSAGLLMLEDEWTSREWNFLD